MSKEKVKLCGEEISKKHFPILYQRAVNNKEGTEEMVKSVAKAWHDGNVVSAMQALESDLQHG